MLPTPLIGGPPRCSTDGRAVSKKLARFPIAVLPLITSAISFVFAAVGVTLAALVIRTELRVRVV